MQKSFPWPRAGVWLLGGEVSMPILSRSLSFSFLLSFFPFSPALGLLLPRGPSGQGSVSSSGELSQATHLLACGKQNSFAQRRRCLLGWLVGLRLWRGGGWFKQVSPKSLPLLLPLPWTSRTLMEEEPLVPRTPVPDGGALWWREFCFLWLLEFSLGVQAPFRIQGECTGLKPIGGFLTHISGPSFHFRKEMEVVPPALPEMYFRTLSF